MTIENLQLRPQRIYAHESDFGTSAARYLWQKMINNHAFVEKSFPIGFVLSFYASQTFPDGTRIQDPNPEIWQLLNGSTVNDPDSPLNGVVLPDFRDLFLKGATQQGIQGGQYTINISHSHGGQTGVTDDRESTPYADSGNDYNTGSPHTHSMSSAWSSAENVIPPYIELQMYMRIK